MRCSDQPPKPTTQRNTDNMTTFAGSWKVVIDTPVGKMAAVFDITDEGGVISGTASSGDDVAKPMKLTLKFDVTVEGDAMTGTSKAAIFPASKLSGTRTTAH